METLVYPAIGAFTISTTWTSTTPFKTQSTSYVSAAAAAMGATRSVYVGGAGNLVLIMLDGSTGTFPNVPAGVTISARAIALSSLNAATSLTGLY